VGFPIETLVNVWVSIISHHGAHDLWKILVNIVKELVIHELQLIANIFNTWLPGTEFNQQHLWGWSGEEH
jgi:hypothetical protein